MIKYKQWLKNKGHWTQQDAYKSEKMDEILKFNHSSESYWAVFSGGAVLYYPKGSGLNFYSDFYTQKSGQKNNSSKIQRFLVKRLLSKTYIIHMADELSRKGEISLPRAYGSSSRAIFLMHLLHRLPSKFGYLRIKELSNIHPDCGC